MMRRQVIRRADDERDVCRNVVWQASLLSLVGHCPRRESARLSESSVDGGTSLSQ
jgi:hypothetical protein